MFDVSDEDQMPCLSADDARHAHPEGVVTPALPVVVVLAAIVERDGRFLVSRRLKGTHLEGLWEFPGGKCAPGETHQMCLARELLEELGVESTIGDEVLVTEHAYAERTVRLHFRRCTLAAEPRPMLGQEIQWVERRQLDSLQFPAADRDLIEMLRRGNRVS